LKIDIGYPPRAMARCAIENQSHPVPGKPVDRDKIIRRQNTQTEFGESPHCSIVIS
jgi:hypothetical protein